MDWFGNIRNIQIDVTSNCNAHCASCARNIYGGDTIPGLPLTNFNVKVWNRLVTEDLKNADLLTLRFEGVWGDPCSHPNLPEMVDVFTRHHPETIITMGTNGGGQDTGWWAKLGEYLSKQSYFHKVEFKVDGLIDTSKLFRRGVDFEKLMSNMQAFIDAGGNASWLFHVFDHNKHQIEEAKLLAENMGCLEFATRKIFNDMTLIETPTEKYTLTAKNLDDVDYDSWTFKDDSKMVRVIRRLKSAQQNYPCRWYKHNQIMIDPWGFVWPCIHISKFTYDDDPMGIIVDDLFDDHGQFNNLARYPLQEVLNHEWYTELHDNAIKTAKWDVCKEECSLNGTV